MIIVKRLEKRNKIHDVFQVMTVKNLIIYINKNIIKSKKIKELRYTNKNNYKIFNNYIIFIKLK